MMEQYQRNHCCTNGHTCVKTYFCFAEFSVESCADCLYKTFAGQHNYICQHFCINTKAQNQAANEQRNQFCGITLRRQKEQQIHSKVDEISKNQRYRYLQ